MKFSLLLTMLLFACCSCDFIQKKETGTEIKKKKALEEDDDDQAQKKSKKTKSDIEATIETNSNAEILNNIIVHESGGLQIARAFLSFQDGRLIPKTNRVAAGTPVFLNLLIEKGWTVEAGMVSPEASERIVTDGGELVLHAQNLFKDQPALEEGKANHIYLKATLLSTRADIDHFVINYHLWDKKGKGEVKGSYKLFIDQPAE